MAWPEQCTFLEDLNEFRWIDFEPWVGIGTKVNSIVPSGFAAYVRVFHPVGSRSGLQRWSAIAKITGRTMHSLAQWDRISTGIDTEARWDPPSVGEPPSEILTPLVSTLRSFTMTPEQCFFAIWDGWGQLHTNSFSSFRPEGQGRATATPVEAFVAAREEAVRSYPRFEFEPETGRPYLLGTGPLEVVLEIADDSLFGRPGVPVSMWWPSDHAWFVASEIDFDSTLAGGSTELCAALLANGDLEALEVPPDGVLSANGDTVNPAP